jgi:RNA polymerase sigma factor (sigma-70 family)
MSRFHSDMDLVTQAEINPQDFAAVYDRFFSQIYNYVRYRVELASDAEDVTSTIFEHIFLKLGSYQQEKGAFTSWIFAIAHNTVADYYRNRKRWEGIVNKVVCACVVTEANGPEAELISNENHEELLRALSYLSPREQDLIALKFAAGLTNRNIARITGLSESNVAVILYRAMLRLRSQLSDGGEAMYG